MNDFFDSEDRLPSDLVEYIDNNGSWGFGGHGYDVDFPSKYYKKLMKHLPQITRHYKAKGFDRVYVAGDDSSSDDIKLCLHRP